MDPNCTSDTGQDLSYIPYCFTWKNIKKFKVNPILSHSVKIWEDVHKYTKWQSPSPQRHLLHLVVPPALRDPSFSLWAQKGIERIEDLYQGDILRYFGYIRANSHIPSMHFFCFLQRRHFIQSKQGGSLERPRHSPLESVLFEDKPTKHNHKYIIYYQNTQYSLFAPTVNQKLAHWCICCGHKLRKWWSDIESILGKVLSQDISLSPVTIMLGDLTDLKLPSQRIKGFVSLAITAAKRCITAKWNHEDLPNITRWIKKVNSCAPLEKITYTIRGNLHLFHKTMDDLHGIGSLHRLID